eukprot:m.31753 g.31753  ORF g.31753 m.31753 type:complete len:325 (+) comp12098_c0_seq2:38-1012(+)
MSMLVHGLHAQSSATWLTAALSGSAIILGYYLYIKRQQSPPPANSKFARTQMLLERLDTLEDQKEIEKAFLDLTLLEEDARVLRLPTKLVSYLCGYDPTNFESSNAVLELEVVRRRTHCLFAKAAVVWGAASNWDACLSEDGTANDASTNTLRAMSLFAAHAHGIDGFVLDVSLAQDTLQDHAAAVRSVFDWLSKHDPSGKGCMSSRFVGKRGWVFHFAGCEMFVTSFSGCYDETNARHCPQQQKTIILFQPYASFVLHNVGEETPLSATDFDHPRTMRDRIRTRFRNHGVWYEIPEQPHLYPASHNMVMPLLEGDPVVRWWES